MELSPDVLNQLVTQIADLRSFQLQTVQNFHGVDQQIVTGVQNAIGNIETQIQTLAQQVQNISAALQNLAGQVQALNAWAQTVIPPGP